MDTRIGAPIDVRSLFPLERGQLLDLLAGLDASAWRQPTVCPGWCVHDVVAHVAHDYVRRLSGMRDGHDFPRFGPSEDLPAYLARVNGEFVSVARSLSPAVLIEVLAHFGPQLDALWTSLDLNGVGGPVWWADPDVGAAVWLDVAREYTEFWVHQQQVRDAVGRPGADRPELLHPVIDTFMRALPHTLRDVPAAPGTTVMVDVTGDGGGTWTAIRDPAGWSLGNAEAGHARAAAHIRIAPDTLWRLATRGISPQSARALVTVDGDEALASIALTILSIIR